MARGGIFSHCEQVGTCDGSGVAVSDRDGHGCIREGRAVGNCVRERIGPDKCSEGEVRKVLTRTVVDNGSMRGW